MTSFPPIPDDDVAALFTYLNRPNPSPCTHSYAQTVDFLRSRSLPIDETIEWLRVVCEYVDALGADAADIIRSVVKGTGKEVAARCSCLT